MAELDKHMHYLLSGWQFFKVNIRSSLSKLARVSMGLLMFNHKPRLSQLTTAGRV